MSKINFTFKKLCLVLLVVLMLVAQNLVLLFGVLDFSKKEVFAETSTLSQISISNSNFTNSSSGDLGDPTSFTTVGTKGSTISGVIDTEAISFSDKANETYKLKFNPSYPKASSDSKVLMINNQDISTGSYFGYKSSSFTLPKNGFYYVSCYIFTQYDDIASKASIYLSNDKLDTLETSKIENISTRGEWKEYRFYVKTNSEDQNVSLVLYIGTKDSFKSNGAVFFDNITAYSVSEKEYYSQLSNSYIANSQIALTNKIVSSSNGILNGDFNDNLSVDFNKVETPVISSENIAKIVGIGDCFNSEDSKITENPTSANRLNNNYALLINNSTPNYTAFKSNDILIEQHKLYKLSIDVKTSSFVNGGAEIKLEQQNPFSSEDYETSSETFTTVNTSSQTDTIKNNWITYSFYIKGNVFKDSYANLTLSLDALSKGYVLFDNIVLEEITTSEYDNNSSSTNSKSVDFSNLSSEPSINNGAFNNVTISSTDEAYPYVAKNIAIYSSDDSNYSGIINVNTNNFNANGYEFSNPGSIYNSNPDLTYNNVLVLANKTLSYQTATTDSFELTASSLDSVKYYKVSLNINTQSLYNYGVNVTLKTSDGEVISNIRNIQSDNKWTEVATYIKMSSNNKSCVLEISLGSEVNNAKGFAFIDNLKLSEIQETTYNEASNLTTNYKTDLNNIDLNLTSENSLNYIYESNNFEGKLNSNTNTDKVEAGIINTTTHPTLNVGHISSPNVLVIHNIEDAYYTLSSKTYSLTSGNYYKITASVKTLYVNQDENNKEQTEDGEVIPFGAKIELSGINESISGIVSENEYSTYTFFVKATSDSTLKFNLSLGNENALTRGYAFFDNLSFNLISEDDFSEAKNSKQEDDDKTIIIGNTDEDKTEEENKTTSPSTNFDWLVVPTLILAVALLVAMVGALLRKLNIKLPSRVKVVKDYDRAKTLVKDMERKEKIKQREEKLKVLRERLFEIQNQLEENKYEYKDTKALKDELKNEHKKIEEKVKSIYKDINTNEAIKLDKKLKNEAKQKIKQERKIRYIERRNDLINKYLEIEKEIEIILEEEKLLVAEWKAYKKQLKQEKLEAKQNKKNKK